MIVFTNPVPGEEDEYNAWYDDQHLADVLGIDGICGAERFELLPSSADASPPRHRYLAIYEIDGDPQTIMTKLSRQAREGSLPISPSLDQGSISVTIWTPRERA
jgi:hypothetical protein